MALSQKEAARVAKIKERFATYLELLKAGIGTEFTDEQLASFNNEQITKIAAQANVSTDGILRDESAAPKAAATDQQKERKKTIAPDDLLLVIKRQQDAIDALNNRLTPLLKEWDEMRGASAGEAAPNTGEGQVLAGGGQNGGKGASSIERIFAVANMYSNTPLGKIILQKFGGGEGGGIEESIAAVQKLIEWRNKLNSVFTPTGAIVTMGQPGVGAPAPTIPSDASQAWMAGKAAGKAEGMTEGFTQGVHTTMQLSKGKHTGQLFDGAIPSPSLNRREPPPRRPAPKNGPCKINLDDR